MGNRDDLVFDFLFVSLDEAVAHEVGRCDQHVRCFEYPFDNELSVDQIILQQRRLAGSVIFSLCAKTIQTLGIFSIRHVFPAAPQIRENQIIFGAEQVVIVKRYHDLAALIFCDERQQQGTPSAEMLEVND